MVQPAEGTKGTQKLERRLLDYAREHIASFKVPRSVDFRDELAMLPTGKLYKRLLRDEYWDSDLTDQVSPIQRITES